MRAPGGASCPILLVSLRRLSAFDVFSLKISYHSIYSHTLSYHAFFLAYDIIVKGMIS